MEGQKTQIRSRAAAPGSGFHSEKELQYHRNTETQVTALQKKRYLMGVLRGKSTAKETGHGEREQRLGMD